MAKGSDQSRSPPAWSIDLLETPRLHRAQCHRFRRDDSRLAPTPCAGVPVQRREFRVTAARVEYPSHAAAGQARTRSLAASLQNLEHAGEVVGPERDMSGVGFRLAGGGSDWRRFENSFIVRQQNPARSIVPPFTRILIFFVVD